MDRSKDIRSSRGFYRQRSVSLIISENQLTHDQVLPTLQIQLSKKPKNNGSPSLLFITGAALRVADVTRVLKEKKLRGKTGGEVAKLFAKHFKLTEHVAYLKRTKIGAAVGTPGRIGKLLRDTGPYKGRFLVVYLMTDP